MFTGINNIYKRKKYACKFFEEEEGGRE